MLLESTSSTTRGTSYESYHVIQGLQYHGKHNENYVRSTGDQIFEIITYYRNCSSGINSDIHGP